jgi:hypothetical protein
MSERGVELKQDHTNPSLWATPEPVSLPFKRGEHCDTGIFEWRVVLLGSDGKTYREGGFPRRQHRARQQYYGLLQPAGSDKAHQAFFKTYPKREGKASAQLQQCMLADFANVLAGKLNCKAFLTRVQGISEGAESSYDTADSLIQQVIVALCSTLFFVAFSLWESADVKLTDW